MALLVVNHPEHPTRTGHDRLAVGQLPAALLAELEVTAFERLVGEFLQVSPLAVSALTSDAVDQLLERPALGPGGEEAGSLEDRQRVRSTEHDRAGVLVGGRQHENFVAREDKFTGGLGIDIARSVLSGRCQGRGLLGGWLAAAAYLQDEGGDQGQSHDDQQRRFHTARA